MRNEPPSNSRHIYSPSKLNRLVRTLLQTELGTIWLSGEISNLVKAASGHWYFTLKDDKAQIKAAMFKQANRSIAFPVKEGDRVLVRANVGLYEPRGDYQLIVEFMQAEGEGALKRQFEALKMSLNQQGLFSVERKRPIPEKIRRVGVITSASGAALHDVLTVMSRRAPDIEVIIYPTLVQGQQASESIINALSLANNRREVDVILITRGGGSLEDLWCFNDEALAHAIADSDLVTISAVGHEIDITISDYVADIRAPTPSAAAELLTPDNSVRQQKLQQLVNRMQLSFAHRLSHAQKHHQALSARLSNTHPMRQLNDSSQYLDQLSMRLQVAFKRDLQQSTKQYQQTRQRLDRIDISKIVAKKLADHAQASQRLHNAWQSHVDSKQQQFRQTVAQLHAISPLATLSRGYSISKQDSHVVSSIEEVNLGSELQTQLKDGKVISKVINTEKM